MQQLQVEIEKAEHTRQATQPWSVFRMNYEIQAESEKVMRQLVEKIRLEEENAA